MRRGGVDTSTSIREARVVAPSQCSIRFLSAWRSRTPAQGGQILDSLSSAHAVYVARQPIFDASNRRIAYELLYRANAQATDAVGISQDVMCSDTALHAVVSIGLDRLTGGALAFVNVTKDHLIGDLYKVFDPTTVVLELLESIDGDADVVAACARAVESGYTLALDDYDSRPNLDALLPYVAIVKLDVLNRTREELTPVIARLLAYPVRVLAERIEDEATRVMCAEIGCELFQGYVFSRPETLGGRTISLQQTTMIRIMGMLGDSRITDTALEDAFQSHPSLTLALLRIVNSASFGLRSVQSIPHAIQLIGREALSRWLMVMLVSSMASTGPLSNEIVLQAMTRGRFCELVTANGIAGDPSARFLVGLLSRIDVLMGQPMASVLAQLPVGVDVKAALLQGVGPHATVLSLIYAFEAGDWEYIDRLQDMQFVAGIDLSRVYSESTAWAHERISAA